MPLHQLSDSSLHISICVAQSCTVHHKTLVHQLCHCIGLAVLA